MWERSQLGLDGYCLGKPRKTSKGAVSQCGQATGHHDDLMNRTSPYSYWSLVFNSSYFHTGLVSIWSSTLSYLFYAIGKTQSRFYFYSLLFYFLFLNFFFYRVAHRGVPLRTFAKGVFLVQMSLIKRRKLTFSKWKTISGHSYIEYTSWPASSKNDIKYLSNFTIELVIFLLYFLLWNR